jgi:hypothetical protein
MQHDRLYRVLNGFPINKKKCVSKKETHSLSIKKLIRLS